MKHPPAYSRLSASQAFMIALMVAVSICAVTDVGAAMSIWQASEVRLVPEAGRRRETVEDWSGAAGLHARLQQSRRIQPQWPFGETSGDACTYQDIAPGLPRSSPSFDAMRGRQFGLNYSARIRAERHESDLPPPGL